MIKIKNKDLLEINGALVYIISQNTPAWYGLGKNATRLKRFLKDIDESRNEVLKKYAVIEDEKFAFNEDGTVKFHDQEGADKAWEEVMEEEVEVPDFYTIPNEKFGNVTLDPIRISPLIDRIIVD